MRFFLQRLGLRPVSPSIIDHRLNNLIKQGLLEDNKSTYLLNGTHISNNYSKEYWGKFIDLCDDFLIDYILSIPQNGTWNGWMYAVCEEKRGIKPNR